ncbi:MAG: DUF2283 domain-containing protein [Saccharothrix sp.]|nr:DUF2283 domain-containing protein [Saccharothrix sp.]
MIEYDRRADAAYIRLAARSVPGGAVKQVVLDDLVAGGEVIFDLDADGRIYGIEILGASECLRGDLLESLE